MSTNRNTKGQFAQKTAPTQLDRIEDHFFSVIEGLSNDLSAIYDKLDQIQRDIDLLKSGSSFMQEVEQHRAQPEEQGLEDGDYCDASRELLADLWKMGFEKDPGRFRPFVNWHAKRRTMITHDVLTGYEGRPFRQLTPADFLARARVTAKKLGLVPEEPKAEPWVPKEGELVVVIRNEELFLKAGELCRFVGDDAVESLVPTYGDGEWHTPITNLRPATPEEIAQAEGEGKLKKLVRGCKVDTPDGEGIYLGRDGSECGREHIVSPDNSDSFWISRYDLDQLTPLT